MSARRVEQNLERCGCGALPCIHKTQAGREFVYYLSCTVCGVATEKTDRCEDAVSDWNEGAVRPAANY
jgi:hypothetical protein